MIINTKDMNKNPDFAITSLNLYSALGKRENRTCEPSNGGIGIKLNTANNVFIKTMIINKKNI